MQGKVKQLREVGGGLSGCGEDMILHEQEEGIVRDSKVLSDVAATWKSLAAAGIQAHFPQMSAELGNVAQALIAHLLVVVGGDDQQLPNSHPGQTSHLMCVRSLHAETSLPESLEASASHLLMFSLIAGRRSQGSLFVVFSVMCQPNETLLNWLTRHVAG